MSDKTIGVFVCECGGKIPRVQVSDLPYVEQADYWCLPASIERMRATIAERHLDRIVIAGCAPRTHAPLFRRALKDVIHPSLISVVNVRDLCAMPHRGDFAGARAKVRDQIAMAVADLCARQPEMPRVARVTPHALVIGGGIAGMTAALAISDADIPVTLVEREAELNSTPDRIAAIRAHRNIRVMTSTTVERVSGTVGQYHITLSNHEVIQAGVIVVAIGARTHDQLPVANDQHYAFVLCDISHDKVQTCKHACCLAAIRQATEIKQHSPDADATIFFRELYTAGGAYDDLIWQAQQVGVKFVRYPAGYMPRPINGIVETHDELMNCDVRVPCDQYIVAEPMTPQPDAARLAEMLRLPIDANGFIADTRVRLRPADYIERGVYVCGAAHFPCDEARAIFQAYDVAARAVQHIQRGEIVNDAPFATIDATRCNGCGDCARVCPFSAIEMQARPSDPVTERQGEWSRLAIIDSLLCTGCGNCVSVCPVKAAQVPSATDEAIEAQIFTALGLSDKVTRGQGASHPIAQSPNHLIFACEWSGYSAAEIAGARGLTYPANTRIIRVNCTGRLQPGLLLKALEMGAAGVMVLGCAPGVCHYEQGNERAAAVFEQANALGHLMGFDKRLALKWILPDDGEAFVRVVSDFEKGDGL